MNKHFHADSLPKDSPGYQESSQKTPDHHPFTSHKILPPADKAQRSDQHHTMLHVHKQRIRRLLKKHT